MTYTPNIDISNKSVSIIVYSKFILEGITSKLYSIQGTNITKAITTGNKTVQQNDIN